MAIGDGFRNGYCLLFLASTFAIAFAIQNFIQGKCCSFPDDIIDFVPYRVCVKQCREMNDCKAISYKQVMSACKLHFQECDPPETCEDYVFSRRSDLENDSEPDYLSDRMDYVKKCPPLLCPRHGKLLGNRFSEGSKVKVLCNPGYILNGNDQRTCQNGQWTGDEASCEEVPNCNVNLVKDIDDDQLSESSNFCEERDCDKGVQDPVSVRYARLNSTGMWTGGWAAKNDEKYESHYVQVDFRQPRIITAILLQGREHTFSYGYGKQWVTEFKLNISYDCHESTFKTVDNGDGGDKIFDGTVDTKTIVVRDLPERLRTRCVRILPTDWEGHPSLRFDVRACP